MQTHPPFSLPSYTGEANRRFFEMIARNFLRGRVSTTDLGRNLTPFLWYSFAFDFCGNEFPASCEARGPLPGPEWSPASADHSHKLIRWKRKEEKKGKKERPRVQKETP